MKKAAELTDNESLRKYFFKKMNKNQVFIFRFLQSRSNAFLSGDYYKSDKDWMDLNSKIEVTIGPYEVNTAHCQLGAASAQETFHPCSGV